MSYLGDIFSLIKYMLLWFVELLEERCGYLIVKREYLGDWELYIKILK